MLPLPPFPHSSSVNNDKFNNLSCFKGGRESGEKETLGKLNLLSNQPSLEFAARGEGWRGEGGGGSLLF